MLNQRQLFLRHVAQTSPAPLMLEVEKAEGVWLFTKDGNRYMDVISGISVNSIGHCHPQVVQAIAEQASRYMHLMVYGEYVYTPQTELSAKLCEWLGEGFESVYLVNSGTEAIEGALKLAKRYTGRPGLVAMKSAYHGSTHGALSLQSELTFTAPFRPLLPDVNFATFNDLSSLDLIDEHVAAVVCEVVQAESGYIPADRAFLTALRQKCDNCGALLIFDEIQTGFGRTGSRFAFQDYGVRPDIIALAKGMGGGMPIGAFVSSKKIMDHFSENPVLGHITTFGGNPVCAAAALAVTQVLEANPAWLDRAEQREQLLRTKLKHPSIRKISGKGLMLAVHLQSWAQVQEVIKIALEKRLVTDWFLFNPEAIRFAPPLSITDEEYAMALEILHESIVMSSSKLLSP